MLYVCCVCACIVYVFVLCVCLFCVWCGVYVRGCLGCVFVLHVCCVCDYVVYVFVFLDVCVWDLLTLVRVACMSMGEDYSAEVGHLSVATPLRKWLLFPQSNDVQNFSKRNGDSWDLPASKMKRKVDLPDLYWSHAGKQSKKHRHSLLAFYKQHCLEII